MLIELYHAVQVISAKIKASGSLSLPENDEYIALVAKHLPKEIAWRWCEQEVSGWTNFFNYLEKKAQTAKKMLTNESINAALSAEGDKLHKCSSCHKTHSGRCQKPKNAAVINQGADKTCTVCDETAHKYKNKSGVEGISKCIKDCPGFIFYRKSKEAPSCCFSYCTGIKLDARSCHFSCCTGKKLKAHSCCSCHSCRSCLCAASLSVFVHTRIHSTVCSYPGGSLFILQLCLAQDTLLPASHHSNTLT